MAHHDEHHAHERRERCEAQQSEPLRGAEEALRLIAELRKRVR